MVLNKKVVRVITDNASNNIKAFGSLIVPGFEPYFEEPADEQGEEVENTGEMDTSADYVDDLCDFSLGGNERLRLPCFIHTLQLVVSDGFKENILIKAAIAKVSGIAKFRRDVFAILHFRLRTTPSSIYGEKSRLSNIQNRYPSDLSNSIELSPHKVPTENRRKVEKRIGSLKVPKLNHVYL